MELRSAIQPYRRAYRPAFVPRVRGTKQSPSRDRVERSYALGRKLAPSPVSPGKNGTANIPVLEIRLAPTRPGPSWVLLEFWNFTSMQASQVKRSRGSHATRLLLAVSVSAVTATLAFNLAGIHDLTGIGVSLGFASFAVAALSSPRFQRLSFTLWVLAFAACAVFYP